MGVITRGTETMTIIVSFTLVIKSQMIPPIDIRIFLRAMETDEPISDCSSVVSVVIRDWISLLLLISPMNVLKQFFKLM